LATKNTVNQITARAMLTQMLHAIFTRMEAALEEQKLASCDSREDIYSSENNDDCEIEKLLDRTTSPLEGMY
jgi:hypothetical protein